MDFSSWLEEERLARGLDTRDVALAAGIDAATVSRIENGDRDVTLLTAVRICDGLGISPAELLSKLREAQVEMPVAAKGYNAPVLSMEDVTQFSLLLKNDRDLGFSVLAKYLNIGVDLFNAAQRKLLMPPEIRRWFPRPAITPEKLEMAAPEILAIPNGVYQMSINYPDGVTTIMIDNLYHAGAALTIQDVSHYLKKLRQMKSEKRSRLQTETSVSVGLIGRVERGEVVLIKLKDALSMSDAFSKGYILFGVFWWALAFEYNFGGSLRWVASRSNGLSSKEVFYIGMLMRGFRWIQLYDGEETEKVKEFRQDLKAG